MAIDTLLPKKLEKTDASYKSVTELNEVLSLAEKEDIRNIALPVLLGRARVLCLLLLWKTLLKSIRSCFEFIE